MWLQQVTFCISVTNLTFFQFEQHFMLCMCLISFVFFYLSQFIADLKKHHELLNVSDSEVMNSLLDENFTLPNTTTLLEQLHTIDNAACGWTNFMSKVCFDVDTIEITRIQIFKSHLHSSYDRKICISDFFQHVSCEKYILILYSSGQCGYLQGLPR